MIAACACHIYASNPLCYVNYNHNKITKNKNKHRKSDELYFLLDYYHYYLLNSFLLNPVKLENKLNGFSTNYDFPFKIWIKIKDF